MASIFRFKEQANQEISKEPACVMNRDSDWLRAGRQSGRCLKPGGGNNFHYSMSSKLALGPIQPPIQWAEEALSPVVKRLGRETGHSPPTSVEVKQTWVYTFILPYTFIA
jgi:hypothetical protein